MDHRYHIFLFTLGTLMGLKAAPCLLLIDVSVCYVVNGASLNISAFHKIRNTYFYLISFYETVLSNINYN